MRTIRRSLLKYCCNQEAIYRSDLIKKYKNIAPSIKVTRIFLIWLTI
jgi:hypothetical protein